MKRGRGMSAPTAHRETRSLVQSLRNAGWGPLAGGDMQGVRSVLDGLVASLPYKSGAGMVTVAQLADRAGLSTRWTADRLALLEALGLVEWHRGGVDAGRPMPSHMRVIKSALVELIALARPALDKALAARRAATAARIAGIVRLYRKPRRHRPLSGHVELSSDLRPLTGESTSGEDSPPHESPRERPVTMKLSCPHSADVRYCHQCVSLDHPPAGYAFRRDMCLTCGLSPAGHAKTIQAETYKHMFIPEIVRSQAAGRG